MGVVSRTGAVLTKGEFDRLLQEPKVSEELIRGMADTLRALYASAWLVAFYNPSAVDFSTIGFAVRNCFQKLSTEGRAPEWSALHDEAQEWLKRFLHPDRIARLRSWTEQVAAKVAGDGVAGGSGEIILNSQTRGRVVTALAQDLRAYLGPEHHAANDAEIGALADWLVQENLGAGALEQFLRDQSLTEIMVGAGGRIWVEKDGRVQETGQTLAESRAVWFAQRLAAVIGSRIDQSEPSMDGFLSDGSRVHIILPPVAMDGVSITIRRHSRRPTLEQLVAGGAISPAARDFLADVVRGMGNLLISGGTSSGKTTILNVAAGFIHEHERVLTMEDSPELQLGKPHLIRLRTRKANIEGRGEFTMRMLVRESLRMRPDRVVVGEVRGAEALDMIEAMNTGHDGCLSTAHANGPLDMLKRLSQMMKRGDPQLTDSGAFELIASALHLIVHAERRVSGDGRVTRGIMEIVEVEGYRPDRPGTQGFALRPIFRRTADQRLERVGGISGKLALHLRLNGIDPDRWVTADGS